VLDDGNTSDPIELGDKPDHMVVIRVAFADFARRKASRWMRSRAPAAACRPLRA
jgi:hypothetical protein